MQSQNPRWKPEEWVKFEVNFEPVQVSPTVADYASSIPRSATADKALKEFLMAGGQVPAPVKTGLHGHCTTCNPMIEKWQN